MHLQIRALKIHVIPLCLETEKREIEQKEGQSGERETKKSERESKCILKNHHTELSTSELFKRGEIV